MSETRNGETRTGATIVVDAFWGDSGKGKIAAYLACRDGIEYCVRAGTGTNAGHSIHLSRSEVVKTRQLPLSGVMSDGPILIGSGVAVDPEILAAEISELDGRFGVNGRLRIDERCPVIQPEYREREAEDSHLATAVGSTASGTGVALSEFRLRRAIQARSVPSLEPFCADVARIANEACSRGEGLLIEGSQGTHLSLALTHDYPYCTSDNCTAVAFADDVGLSWRHISEVVLVVKALPSRVGEGPLPFQMPEEEQDRLGIQEYGVATGRRRRKADRISWPHLEEAVMLNGPTQIALTFCDHFDPAIADSKDLTPAVARLIGEIEERTGVPVTMVETGKLFESVVDV